MSNELAGKIALVTGASKGIGAGIATAFGAAGASVAVGYARDKEGAGRVVSEIEAAGGRAIAVQGDLSKADDVETMVGKVVAAFGPLDILVNNGAVFDFKALPERRRVAPDVMIHPVFRHTHSPSCLAHLGTGS